MLLNDEIVTAVTIPAVARNRAAHFEKLALVEGGFRGRFRLRIGSGG